MWYMWPARLLRTRSSNCSYVSSTCCSSGCNQKSLCLPGLKDALLFITAIIMRPERDNPQTKPTPIPSSHYTFLSSMQPYVPLHLYRHSVHRNTMDNNAIISNYQQSRLTDTGQRVNTHKQYSKHTAEASSTIISTTLGTSCRNLGWALNSSPIFPRTTWTTEDFTSDTWLWMTFSTIVIIADHSQFKGTIVCKSGIFTGTKFRTDVCYCKGTSGIQSHRHMQIE